VNLAEVEVADFAGRASFRRETARVTATGAFKGYVAVEGEIVRVVNGAHSALAYLAEYVEASREYLAWGQRIRFRDAGPRLRGELVQLALAFHEVAQ
jgi:hypothetical protein